MDTLSQTIIQSLPGILLVVVTALLSQWRSGKKIEINRREANAKAENIRTETAAQVEANRVAQETFNRELVVKQDARYDALNLRYNEVSNRASASTALVDSLQNTVIAASDRERKSGQEMGELRASVVQRTRELDLLSATIDKMKADKSADVTSIAALTTKLDTTLDELARANEQLTLLNKQVTVWQNRVEVLLEGGTPTAATIAANQVNVAADAEAAQPDKPDVEIVKEGI